MKASLTLAIAFLLACAAHAQERIARVGYLSWQDNGVYYEATLGVTIPQSVLLRADEVIQ